MPSHKSRYPVSRFISFFGLALLVASACFADDTASKKAFEIKTKSDNFMRKELKDFSATMTTKVNAYGQTIETSAKYYQKNNISGKYFARTETGSGDTSQVILINKEGMWNINGNEAEKTDFYDQFAKIMDNLGLDEKSGIDLTLEPEGKANKNIPCYVVKQNAAGISKYLTEAQDIAGKGIPSEYKEIMKNSKFKDMLPDNITYLIGKDNYFLYATNSYNSKNELLSSVTYKDVKLNTGLKDDFFTLPVNIKIKPAPSMDEMLKELKEMEEKK